MPELPEVETIKLQLNTVLPGLTIKEIKILSPKSFGGEKKEIIGKRITGIRRFGKMFVVDLDNGLSLGIHLKMTGRLIYRGKKQPKDLKIGDPNIQKLPSKHTRVIIYFTSGDKLYFNDLRKFGWIRVMDKSQVTSRKFKLGIEPFTNDFTIEKFQKVLASSKKPIKLLLMDQEKIVGVGNIYANEALFCAKINPKIPSNKINSSEIAVLYDKVLGVLKDGIKWRGASDDAYLDAFGQQGEVQKHFCVYNQEGKKCPNKCGGTIKKIKLGGRGTYFCPACQTTPVS